MTKIRQIILVIFTIMAWTILLLSIIYFFTIIMYHTGFTFNFSNICYCEEQNFPFIFDYNRLGEGIQPIYHFKNMETISGTIKELKGQTGIYLWHNRVNGDTYVGSAIDLYERLLDYGQTAYLNSGVNSRIINSLNKYPLDCWDLIIIVVLTRTGVKMIDRKVLAETETYWIKQINATLNILTLHSSWLGYNHSEESKRKISEVQKGKKLSDETKAKLSAANSGENHPQYGIPKSDETKAKISEANSGINHGMYGKKHTDETRAKMSAAQSGINHPQYGKKQSEEVIANRVAKVSKTTYKFDKEGGTLLATYNSMKEAAIANNVVRTSLNYAIRNGNSFNGFFYTYNKDGSSSKK